MQRANSLENTDAGKDWRQKEKEAAEDKMVRQYHQLNEHEFEQTLGNSGGQRSLGCCSPWGHIRHDFSSVQFSRSVLSNSLRPHESQHARPPCPSPTPGVHSNSRPSSRWCHPAISSSVVPFSSCSQSLPASESFPMSQLFAWLRDWIITTKPKEVKWLGPEDCNLIVQSYYSYICPLLKDCQHSKSLQSCPALYHTMDGSPPDSSVHGIFQARILERFAIFYSRVCLYNY